MNITLTAENSQKHFDHSYNDDWKLNPKNLNSQDIIVKSIRIHDRGWYGIIHVRARIVDKTIFIKDIH